MAAHKARGRTLQVGDRIRLKPGTPTWAQREDLRGKVGEVVALEDGTQLHRITVAFDGWRLPPGLYEEHVEKVAQ